MFYAMTFKGGTMANRYCFPFEKLEVWQEARRLVSDVYKVTRIFPPEEKFGLVSQINRAAVSVASNLAEGCSRMSRKDQANFSQIAYGSLMELVCQLTLAVDLGFVDEAIVERKRTDINILANRLNALRKSQLLRQKR
jgi:four helix bundle protein